MNKVNVFAVEGTEFPAGRRTRVLIGSNGAIHGQYFCQGYVVIYPGGDVPAHQHESVETYTIIQGTGMMTVDDETVEVHTGDIVYMDRNQTHGLKNTGTDELHMMFVYAPPVIAGHWKQELSGELT